MEHDPPRRIRPGVAIGITVEAVETLDEVGVVFGGLRGIEPRAAVATKVSMGISHLHQPPLVSSEEAEASGSVDSVAAARSSWN